MRIGFVGSGSMAGAIARGAAHSAAIDSLMFSDAGSGRAGALADELGGQSATNERIAAECDIVVLAVKPYAIREVCTALAPTIAERGGVCVASLAAGTPIDTLSAALGDVPIVRVMPNVNAQIGQSMSALCANKAASTTAASFTTNGTYLDAVRALMNAVGTTLVIDEDKFAVFSALAGCSPAWVFQIIEALARAGVKYGLSKSQATTIAAQAVAGSASLVLDRAEDGIVPAQLIDQVCSPGGTTIAGLLASEEAGLSNALVAAVEAAVQRDGELR